MLPNECLAVCSLAVFFRSTAPRACAEIVAACRAAIRPSAQADCRVAAIARSPGMTVATRNLRDFMDTGLVPAIPCMAEKARAFERSTITSRRRCLGPARRGGAELFNPPGGASIHARHVTEPASCYRPPGQIITDPAISLSEPPGRAVTFRLAILPSDFAQEGLKMLIHRLRFVLHGIPLAAAHHQHRARFVSPVPDGHDIDIGHGFPSSAVAPHLWVNHGDPPGDRNREHWGEHIDMAAAGSATP